MEDNNIIISSDMLRENRVPPGQWLTNNFPVLQYGEVPMLELDSWQLRLFGLVKEEKSINREAFSKLPVHKVKSDIHCVTTWSQLDTNWEGVRSFYIKELVDILPEAEHVMLHSADTYTTNLSLTDFFDEDVLLATKFNDKSLALDHGFPVRVVVPKLYFWKSAKWITGIEFMKDDRKGYWEQRGYHNRGNPWDEERFS